MASKLIRESSNKNASRLIKAMSGWGDNFYTNPPDGVFGSKVIIKCNGVTIDSDNLDIAFEIPFDDDLEPNEAEITIYNLSTTTENQFEKKKKITVEAGFTGDTGVIFTGYVDKKKTTYDRVDKTTVLYCVDRASTNEMKEITFKKGTKASTILKTLINKTGTPIAVFKVRRDYTYKDEQKVDGNLQENIKRYSEVCGVSTYINKGKVYCRYLKEGDALDFTLSEDTGLIGSPSEFESEIALEDSKKETIKGYECECLLQHRFSAGGRVTLKSRDVSGTYRICSGTHTFNIAEAVTKVKMY